jgi:hypothetical protein
MMMIIQKPESKNYTRDAMLTVCVQLSFHQQSSHLKSMHIILTLTVISSIHKLPQPIM